MATTMATTSTTDRQSVGRSDARILTELAIKNLKHGERRTDGALPSGNGRLVVSCTKARGRTRRVWTFRYRKSEVHGELMLGQHPGMTLEQARTEARRLVELVRDGLDPKIARVEARRAVTSVEVQGPIAADTPSSFRAFMRTAPSAAWDEARTR